MVWGSPYAWFYISHGVLPGFNNQQLETQLEMKIGTSNVVFWLCVVNHDPLDVGPFLPLLFWIVLAPQACFVFSSWHFHCATFSFRQLTTSNQSNQVPVARSLHLQNLWVNNWKNPRQKPQSSDLPVANLVFGGQSAANCPWKNGYFCITWILPENDVTTESDWCFSSVFCFVSFKNWDTIWIFLDVPGNAQWLHGKMWRILGLECVSPPKSPDFLCLMPSFWFSLTCFLREFVRQNRRNGWRATVAVLCGARLNSKGHKLGSLREWGRDCT